MVLQIKKLITALALITMFLYQVAAQSYHALYDNAFTQDWSNPYLIVTNDNWSGVPSIQGFLGDDPTGIPGVDPQLMLKPFVTLDVIANATNPNTNTTGGVAQFAIIDPVVALQGSGTADFPHLILYMNTTNCSKIRVQYDLRDIDGSTDNAVQPVALQYRIGNTGDFVNIPEGFVFDATTGPSLATLVTHIDLVIPSSCDNQPELQLRIITSNATGSDEWIGIDNIVISNGGDIINTSGILESNTPDIYNVFPNPSHGKITIQSVPDHANISIGEINIYNMLGEKVYTDNNNSLNPRTIDLSGVPYGVYFLTITSGANFYSKKFILQ